MVALAGCKTLQETAESKEVTQPEGVALMTEAELRKTLVGNTYEGESVNYPGSTMSSLFNPMVRFGDSGMEKIATRERGSFLVLSGVTNIKTRTDVTPWRKQAILFSGMPWTAPPEAASQS